MTEGLEQYMSSHKTSFDVYDPPAGLWTRINQELGQQPKAKTSQRLLLNWRIAASVLLLVGTASFFWLTRPVTGNNTALVHTDTGNHHQNRILAGIDTNMNFIWADSNDATADSLREYMRLVAARRQQIALLQHEQPSLYEQFSSDLNALDISYNQLRARLDSGTRDVKILRALLQNLKTQATILDRQLEISSDPEHKKYTREKNISSI